MSTKTSCVWQYFKLCDEAASDSNVQCLICGKKYTRNHGTTGSMRRHLENKHPEKFAELRHIEGTKVSTDKDSGSAVKKQLTLTSMLAAKKPELWPDNNPESRQLDQRILEMIAVDNQPFSFVEGEGFKRVMEAANPHYRLKTEKFYRSKLPSLYDAVSREVRKLLINSGHKAFTCDIWSEGKLALLSLTVHFITEHIERKELLLHVKPFVVSHTGVNIAEALKDTMEEWGISTEEVHLLLRDGASNMKVAGEALGVPTAHCAAHKLNLIVKDSISSQLYVKRIVEKGRSLVGHFHHSVTAQAALRVIQEQLGLPIHALEQDIEIRWNSTISMIRRLIEQEDALVLYSSRHRSIDTFNSNEIDITKKMVALLEVFEQFTLEVSKSTSSVSCVLPLVHMTLAHLNGLENDKVAGCNTMREHLIEGLKTRFAEEWESPKHLVATVMDPRFKLECFETANQRNFAMSVTIEALKEASNEIGMSINTGIMDGTEQSTGLSFSALFATAKRARISEIDNLMTENDANSSQLVKELEAYLAKPTLPFETEPLEVWRGPSASPVMKALVRKYLAPPPSSVPSERIFSRVGGIYEPRSRSLKGDNVNRLLFLSVNLPEVNFKYDK